MKSIRTLAALAIGAVSTLSLPQPAAGQPHGYYTPPKLIKQGSSLKVVPGAGLVTIKVFVRKNGTIGAITVVKSTNHADDPTGLDIARNSTYKPGLRDGKPIDAFYTMALKFRAGSVVNDTGTASSELLAANASIRANKFAQAQTELQTYLKSHPGDRDAEALLGVADTYLNDAANAAAAFDAAGTIPSRFKIVAAKAYADAAVDALKAKDNGRAIALAGKSLALQQSVNSLYIRGTAYANAQKYSQAITDLEKAKAQATSGHADAATLNAIDASLATSYIFGGQAEKGLALARSLKLKDPSSTRIDDTLAAYYNQQAIAAMQAGRKDEAVADLESAALAVPSRAVALYVQAANVLAQGTSPNWRLVRLEAGKALAIDPNDARANYVAGIALANQGDKQDAIPFLQKARASSSADAALKADIDAALKRLGAPM